MLRRQCSIARSIVRTSGRDWHGSRINSAMRLAQALLLFVSMSAHATDVFVLQGQAVGPNAPCALVTWTGMMSFFNSGSTDAVVRLVGVSGGGDIGDRPRELVVPPRQLTQTFLWNFSPAPLWVLHLDVPESVTVESRMNVGEQRQCPPFPPLDLSATRGKIDFPIRTSLSPANQPQIHLGTDLGTIRARNNIAVYNGGTRSASARVEIRRGCDDALVESREVVIEANAVIQVMNLPGTSTCDPFGNTRNAPFLAYAVVTVDQPSVSWVSSISNEHATNVVYSVD